MVKREDGNKGVRRPTMTDPREHPFDKRTFEKFVRDWVWANRTSFKELAKRAGMSASALSRVITDGSIPTIETLSALAKGMEVDASELVYALMGKSEADERAEELTKALESLSDEDLGLLSEIFGLQTDT
jgi:transcriptional regulator with XRE-family HTH domain